MLHHLSAARWMSLCSAVLLAACGGSGGGAGAPTGGGATPSTTLSISPSALVLSVNNTAASPALTGSSRSFTITNNGTVTAQAVIHAVSTSSPAWPSGTGSTSNCTSLAPGASCTITVTPGNTPSAAVGTPGPVPITLSVGGSNTNLLTPTVQVVTHGSVYQGGYLFDVDDTTPATGSIGGKVAALNDAGPSVFWSAGAGGGVVYDDIAEVSDVSTGPLPACDGLIDGKCNTKAIVDSYPLTPLPAYAAGTCRASRQDSFDDWYLPAICELNGSSGRVICPASQQSIQDNLVDVLPGAGGLPAASYWSSTQSSALPNLPNDAWSAFLQQTAGAQQNDVDKSSLFLVRCVRALTY